MSRSGQSTPNAAAEVGPAVAKHRIAVLSGKGGVGKTSLAVNLATCFAATQARVGLLDADITGPNVAHMLGIRKPPRVVDGRIVPQPAHGVHVVSIASLVPPEAAVIWRGPLRSRAVSQLLEETAWGTLDYLVVDLPPGTGDEVLTVGQRVKPQVAVVVTTPQQVAMGDARRAIDMARKMDVPWIGLVENMSGITCPHCGEPIALFGTGTTAAEARRLGVHDLGAVPFDPLVAQSSDAGTPLVVSHPGNSAAVALRLVAELVAEYRLDPA